MKGLLEITYLMLDLNIINATALLRLFVDGSIFFFFFNADEKLFELFWIENDFAKYFAKFRNLSIILFRTL